MKKGFTLIELLAVIVILGTISVIAYPKVVDVIQASKVSAYNSSKVNIIESAKLKYLADLSNASSNSVEYKVVDLIDDGYLNKDAKNPLTSEDYDENTKVLITNEEGNISYSYIEGETLYDIVSLNDYNAGVYKEDLDYYYKGSNSENYVSFDGEVYRIIMVDSYRYVYLLKDELNNSISASNLDEYITSYYNDNYSENSKSKIKSFDILDYEMYKNSFIDSNTYILNNNNIWVKYNNEYKVLSYINNDLTTSENADIRFVIKLNNDVVVLSGDGTQVNPYIIE